MRYSDSPCRCRARKAGAEYAEGAAGPEKEPLDQHRCCFREDATTGRGVFDHPGGGDPDGGGRLNGTLGTLSTIDRRLRDLTSLLSGVVARRAEQDDRERVRSQVEMEWRHMAMVLDRIFFSCYLVVIVLSLVIFFPRRSYG